MLLGLIESHVWMKPNEIVSQVAEIIGKENIQEKGCGSAIFIFKDVHLENCNPNLYRVIEKEGSECVFDPYKKGLMYVNQ